MILFIKNSKLKKIRPAYIQVKGYRLRGLDLDGHVDPSTPPHTPTTILRVVLWALARWRYSSSRVCLPDPRRLLSMSMSIDSVACKGPNKSKSLQHSSSHPSFFHLSTTDRAKGFTTCGAPPHWYN